MYNIIERVGKVGGFAGGKKGYFMQNNSVDFLIATVSLQKKVSKSRE